MEYFRHTEADRTLIGWEMLESGDFVIPRILGEVILTKPPIFYWLIAGSISFFGEASEFAARVPSLICGVLSIISLFVFLRRTGFSSTLATQFSLMMGTGMSLFINATVAEIDMTYAFFSAVTFYCGFALFFSPSIIAALSAYFFLGLAFLTKGPPTVAFFGISQLLMLVVYLSGRLRSSANLSSTDSRQFVQRFFILHAVGLLLFSLMVFAWLYPVASQVSWAKLGQSFYDELFLRALEDTRRSRGWHFYLGALLEGVAPWSPLFLIGLFLPRCQLWKDESLQRIYYYSLSVLIPGIVLLSLSEGKSSRYLLPLYPLAIVVVGLGWVILKGRVLPRWGQRIFLFLTALCGIAVGTLLVGQVFFWSHVSRFVAPEIVPLLSTWTISLALLIAGVGVCALVLSLIRQQGALFLLSVMAIMVTVRLVHAGIYVPYRNVTRSVKPVVAQINNLVPPEETIYSVRLYERWISYYLKRTGRSVLQDSEANVLLAFSPVATTSAEPASFDKVGVGCLGKDKVYFLLSEEDDFPEVKALVSSIPSKTLLGNLTVGPNQIGLWRLDCPAVLTR